MSSSLTMSLPNPLSTTMSSGRQTQKDILFYFVSGQKLNLGDHEVASSCPLGAAPTIDRPGSVVPLLGSAGPRPERAESREQQKEEEVALQFTPGRVSAPFGTDGADWEAQGQWCGT